MAAAVIGGEEVVLHIISSSTKYLASIAHRVAPVGMQDELMQDEHHKMFFFFFLMLRIIYFRGVSKKKKQKTVSCLSCA